MILRARNRFHENTAEHFDQLQADYNGARASRFRRRRTGVSASGSGADYHYRSESDYLRMLEQARDMDRNDAVIGQAITRAATNCIQDGITVDVATGSKELDKRLTEKWQEWSSDADKCDIQQEMDFHQLEHAALRATFADGDIVALGIRATDRTPSGPLQMIEAHRLRTPLEAMKGDMNLVHGFMLDHRRRRVAIRITKDDIDPWVTLGRLSQLTKPFPIRDAAGKRQIFHVYDPKRITQTRGVTALAPIFDCAGMFEDLNFAKLIQAQIVSCIAIFRQRETAWQPVGEEDQRGSQSTQTRTDGSTRLVEGIAPGMEIFGAKGEKLSGFSPNVPNPEFFPHVKLILTLIGINLGLPLILMLLDGSETNFSGWRGALDQAKLGFRHNQRWLIGRFHRPVYCWKVRQWLDEDSLLGRLAKGAGDDGAMVQPYGHHWNCPGWPYIEPKKDAESDDLRQSRNLISPRRRAAERGIDFDKLTTEIVEDRAQLIEKAWLKKEELVGKYPELDIDWRDLAFDNSARKALEPDGDELREAMDAD